MNRKQKNMHQEPKVEDLLALEIFQNAFLHHSEENQAKWELWINNHPEYQPIVAEAKQLLISMASSLSDDQVEDKLNTFWETAGDQAKSKTKYRSLNWISRAAAVLLIIGSSFWLYAQYGGWVQVDSSYAEMQQVQLPDGSSIILNSNSSVRYQRFWSFLSTRDIYLSGEAFLNIESDPQKPFITHTSQGDVRVLGTIFNVRQRGTSLDVALEEGRVQVEVPQLKEPIILSPQDYVSITDGQPIQKYHGDISQFSSWRTGQLIFENTPVQDIIERYRYELGWTIMVLNDAVKLKRITATVPSNNPELIISALQTLYDLKVERVDSTTFKIQ